MTTKTSRAAAAKAKGTTPKGTMTATFSDPPKPEEAEALAKMTLRPSINAAAVMVEYTKAFGTPDIGALAKSLADGIDDLWAGDMKRAEAMLYGQAHALQAIFMNLARRAASQEYLKQWEAYLRMAMKAQNQCRMTLETLALLKNPPVVIARQANINNGGQQQVNNGTAAVSAAVSAHAHAGNQITEQSKLLEVSDGQRLDTRATSATGGTDQHMAPVAAVNRPAHR